MPLDPQVKRVLESVPFGALGDLAAVPAPLMRQATRAMFQAPAAPVPVARVEDRRMRGPGGELGVRIYTPGGRAPLPLLLFFHGGGFVICDLDSHDDTCRRLANGAGCVVVSVDYRLAPEHPFPAAPEDCFAALCWAVENAPQLGADAARVAVAGDSAGGNLATVVAHLARDRGGPPLRHQLLVYPVTDCDFETPSYREHAEGYLLTRAMMQWFWGHYLARPEDAANPLASPLRALDLAGLPPATLITAEYDPLRDEGEAYARRLAAAGVPTRLTRYDGMIHGFFGMVGAIDRAEGAVREASAALRGALHTS